MLLLLRGSRHLLPRAEQELCKAHSKKYPRSWDVPHWPQELSGQGWHWAGHSPLTAFPVCQVLPISTTPFVPCSSCTLI